MGKMRWEKWVSSSCGFDKESSLAIKGLAILLMIAHHLFAFSRPLTLALDYGENKQLYRFIGVSGKMCVVMFMFVAGYGTFVSLQGKSNLFGLLLKKVKAIYFEFWKISAFPIIGLLLLGLLNVGLFEFVANALCLSSSINGTWWFLQTYIIFLLLVPVSFMLVSVTKYAQLLILLVVVVIFPLLSKYAPDGYFRSSIHYAFYYFPAFYCGIFFAKHQIYNRVLSVFVKRSSQVLLFGVVLALAFAVRIVWGFNIATILIVAALCGFASLWRIRFFVLLGEYSMGMWLIHDFFIDPRYLSKWMILITDSPILIFLAIALISYFLAYVISRFWTSVDRVITGSALQKY